MLALVPRGSAARMRAPAGLGLTAIVAVMGLTLAACSEQPISAFSIVSGSENRTLEPIVQEFCKTEHVACSFEYMGSLDIGMAVADNRGSFDAVWPANSFWIEMFDRDKRVRDLTSVMHSPVILGVRLGKAQELGWVGPRRLLQGHRRGRASKAAHLSGELRDPIQLGRQCLSADAVRGARPSGRHHPGRPRPAGCAREGRNPAGGHQPNRGLERVGRRSLSQGCQPGRPIRRHVELRSHLWRRRTRL